MICAPRANQISRPGPVPALAAWTRSARRVPRPVRTCSSSYVPVATGRSELAPAHPGKRGAGPAFGANRRCLLSAGATSAAPWCASLGRLVEVPARPTSSRQATRIRRRRPPPSACVAYGKGCRAVCCSAAVACVAGRLSCPVCSEPLAPAVGALICSAGHRYDVAREGYVSLFAAGVRHASGDDAGMVAARVSVERAGHLEPLTAALVEAAGGVVDAGTSLVLDVGAGPVTISPGSSTRCRKRRASRSTRHVLLSAGRPAPTELSPPSGGTCGVRSRSASAPSI